jgi:1-acyl-sn-glycerol-3-phosphate acyltransferase
MRAGPGKGVIWGIGIAAAVAALLPAAILCAAGGRKTAMRWWCGGLLKLFGVRATVRGPLPLPGSLVVLNHVSYLDILVVGARAPGSFIAKAEIGRWPVFNVAAALGGTIFVPRASARRSRDRMALLAKRLAGGERVILFAEGGIPSETGGVAPFRTMFFEAALRSGRPVVPGAIRYLRPSDPAAWRWGDGHLAAHLFGPVFACDTIEVELRFGDPVPARTGVDRKALAEDARREVGRLYREGDHP